MTSSPSLEELYAQQTEKASDKWSSYLREYDRIFGRLRDQPIRLLEIGVQNGGSLDIWSKFFPQAVSLIGCDINPDIARLQYEDPRISLVVGDASLTETRDAILAQSQSFDLIIDDGSHRSGDIIRTFVQYFPHLRDGGIYVVEDLHCSYWQGYEGGLYDPFSAITFFKRLVDIVNHEHWGVAKPRAEILQGIAAHYGTSFEEDPLTHIHAVEFTNSVCVVHKADAAQNSLGIRVVAGSEEAVLGGHKPLHGSTLRPSTQEVHNPWTIRDLPPDEELPQRVQELSQSRQEVASLQQVVAALREELSAAHAHAALREGALAARDRSLVDLVKRNSTLEEQKSALRVQRDEVWAKVRLERQEKKRFAKELEQKKRALQTMQRSPAWRYSRPFRVAAGFVKRRRQGLLKKLGRADATAKGASNVPSPKPPIKKETKQPVGLELAYRRARKVLRQQGMLGATGRLVGVLTKTQPLAPSPSKKPAVAKRPPGPKGRPDDGRNDYAQWLRRYDTLSPELCAAWRARMSGFAFTPRVSILMPTFNTDPKHLVQAIESVRAQIYPNWELCIADDASTSAQVHSILEHYAREDARIRVVFRTANGHISKASNSALELATGEYVALFDHDDLLQPHALFWVVDTLNEHRDARVLYSDEDKLSERGERFGPYFKCEFNEDLFRSHNMICHLGVYEAGLVREVGGFREGFEGAQDYDLALRCIERLPPSQIRHIPRVLYSWRVHEKSTASSADAKPYALLAGQRALSEHFARLGVEASVEPNEFSMYRVRYALGAAEPLVSIIIPTRNALRLVRQCIESILERTSYAAYEILLIDNGSDDPDALRYFSELESHPKIRVIRDDRPFNYSALNNHAVRLSRGEFVCLLNNDIEVVTPDWLSELVSFAAQPKVGAVGARLWYPNDTLQHGGVILGILGVAGHAHKHLAKGQPGYFGRASLVQSLSAVTGACLLIRKSIYEELGGLNENELQIAFNDVDFCLRVREAGYRNIWTPYAELYHHESATRGLEDTAEKQQRFAREIRYMKARWGRALATDPAYSPNLTLQHEDFSLAWPPRLRDVLEP